ncbi:MAG: hypothetical protein ACKO6L_09045 [Flavobacteriales bacterium]
MHKSSISALILTIIFASCKKDNDSANQPTPPSNDGEIITSLILELTDTTTGSNSQSFAFRDLDAEGANAPVQWDTIRLAPQTVYDARIIVLNEISQPVDTLSLEIADEADEHLFCFDSNVPGLNILRTDSDGTFEIGLASRWFTPTAGTGEITVTLKHQPGIKDGTCLPGETDIEVTFPCIIE